jgi:DNA-binding LacI/PurR family transcriptional regulator
MDDIARRAGVSKATVSRALNGSPLIPEATRNEILRIARECGYAMNENARKLWSNRADTVALVLDFLSVPGRRLSQPFHFELLADIIKELNARKLSVLLVAEQGETAEDYAAKVKSRTVDGIIFVGQGQQLQMFRRLQKMQVPFVVWGAPDRHAKYCTIGTDNRLGGRKAGERFLQLGRKNILFIGRLDHLELSERHAGLKDALETSSSRRTLHVLEPNDLSPLAARTALEAFLQGSRKLPDGIFCATDTQALAILALLRERGVEVPQQVSVIGYDDIPDAELHAVPKLTTVRQSTQLAGEALVNSLVKQIAGEKQPSIVLPTELVVRQT